MKYLLGIDLGTSATKTVLFDQYGATIASAECEYPLIQLQANYAEQDPSDWENACYETIKQVIAQANIQVDDIIGLGISGQMHGLVLVDADGQILRNAILWCDGRTSDQCAEITEIIGAQRLIEISANPALVGFTAGKLLWVRQHEPDIYHKIHKVLLPKDYLRYKLTNNFACEVSDASGTNLFDVAARCWSDEIISKLDLPRDIFPPVFESVAIAGQISDSAALKCGLSTKTLVCMGAGDNAAAAIGTGVVSKGKAFTTIGTSGVTFAYSDKVQIDPQGRVHTFCHAVENAWTVMSCTLSAGASLKWYRDNFLADLKAFEPTIDSYEILNREIEQIPIGSKNLIYLPYLMGERSPILDEKTKGVFFGLHPLHNRFDLARSVMEGVTFSLKQCLEIINEMQINPSAMALCGGGAKSIIWRQMVSDVFNLPVYTAHNTEGPAMGVAILAAVATGLYPSVEVACEKWIKSGEIIQPNMKANEAYKPYYQIYTELYPQLKTSFKKLSTIK